MMRTIRHPMTFALRRARRSPGAASFLGAALSFGAVVCAVVLTGALPAVVPASAASLAVVGGTMHPVSSEPYVGTLVIEDGKIQAAGPDVVVPAGATTIDAAGLHVYPGLMDAMGQLGLLEVSAVSATDDRAEMGLYNPHLDAITAIHPSSALIGVTRANGITHALVTPEADRDGVIAGRAALVHLDGWTVEEMAIEPSVAMVIKWPGIVTRHFDFATFSFKESAFNEAKDAATEKQNELRDWFDAARQYRQAKGAKDSRAERDLKLEHLAACLDRGLPVIIQANAKRDIEAAMAFADEENVRMILAGGRDAWKLADELAAKGIPVILGDPQSLPHEEDDPYGRPYDAPAMLVAAGVKIAFGSGAAGGYGSSPHAARSIPYESAQAEAFGLDADAALKAVTLWPAEILDVADRLGSIEPGKIANLIVTTGNPLELQSSVRHLIIDGREVSTENMHRELYERYRARPPRS